MIGWPDWLVLDRRKRANQKEVGELLWSRLVVISVQNRLCKPVQFGTNGNPLETPYRLVVEDPIVVLRDPNNIIGNKV